MPAVAGFCWDVFFTLTYLTVFLWSSLDLMYLLGVICPYQLTNGKLLVCCHAHWALLANFMAMINFTDCFTGNSQCTWRHPLTSKGWIYFLGQFYRYCLEAEEKSWADFRTPKIGLFLQNYWGSFGFTSILILIFKSSSFFSLFHKDTASLERTKSFLIFGLKLLLFTSSPQQQQKEASTLERHELIKSI